MPCLRPGCRGVTGPGAQSGKRVLADTSVSSFLIAEPSSAQSPRPGLTEAHPSQEPVRPLLPHPRLRQLRTNPTAASPIISTLLGFGARRTMRSPSGACVILG